jgi:precorrin isomerase
MKHLKGEEITRLSFSIIRERMGRVEASEEERDIMVRIAHTTGDVDFSKTFLFLNGAAEAGIASLLSGRTVVTTSVWYSRESGRSPLRPSGAGSGVFLTIPMLSA